MQMPLEDVKTLDLSHALAGPFCSTMLGDFGAQVVKVEVPNVGEIASRATLFLLPSHKWRGFRTARMR